LMESGEYAMKSIDKLMKIVVDTSNDDSNEIGVDRLRMYKKSVGFIFGIFSKLIRLKMDGKIDEEKKKEVDKIFSLDFFKKYMYI